MEYIFIIFFLIFVLYSYLYEYYDECKIKSCSSSYYINNNTCTKCDGIVSPDGKKCCANLSSQGVTSYDNECKPASCISGYYKNNNTCTICDGSVSQDGNKCCPKTNIVTLSYDNQCKPALCHNEYFLNIGPYGDNNGCTYCGVGRVSVSGNSCCPSNNNTGIATYNKDCSANSCKNGKQPYNNCACDFPNQEILRDLIRKFSNANPNNRDYIEVYGVNKVNDQTAKALITYTNKQNNNTYWTGYVNFYFNIDKDKCIYEVYGMGEEKQIT